MIYLVTRHPGALDWLRSQFSEPTVHLMHVDTLATLNPGDCVVGTLPIDKVAQLIAMRIRYFHLCIDVPASLRGKELTTEQLQALHACLREYVATEVADDTALLNRTLALEE
jgi:CRISPR-associated protein Csx16